MEVKIRCLICHGRGCSVCGQAKIKITNHKEDSLTIKGYDPPKPDMSTVRLILDNPKLSPMIQEAKYAEDKSHLTMKIEINGHYRTIVIKPVILADSNWGIGFFDAETNEPIVW